jgi:hypothetical protein
MRESEQRGGDASRDESEHERLDRNLEEMTSELRVVVTGVQVLFAFLLIVPFNVGFEHVGGFERAVYIVTLLLAACSAVCTIAPSAQHRWVFRQDDKRHLVFSANRMMIAGMGFLALAMCGCLLLVTTKLFGAGWGVLTAALASIPFLVLWFAIPMRRAWQLAREQRGRAQNATGDLRSVVREQSSRRAAGGHRAGRGGAGS